MIVQIQRNTSMINKQLYCLPSIRWIKRYDYHTLWDNKSILVHLKQWRCFIKATFNIEGVLGNDRKEHSLMFIKLQEESLCQLPATQTCGLFFCISFFLSCHAYEHNYHFWNILYIYLTTMCINSHTWFVSCKVFYVEHLVFWIIIHLSWKASNQHPSLSLPCVCVCVCVCVKVAHM